MRRASSAAAFAVLLCDPVQRQQSSFYHFSAPQLDFGFGDLAHHAETRQQPTDRAADGGGHSGSELSTTEGSTVSNSVSGVGAGFVRSVGIA